MTCRSPNNYCFSIVQGQGNAPLVSSLPSSCYMTNHVGAQNPHLPSLVLFIWKLEPRAWLGLGGGGGGKRGIGYLLPYSGNSDCYKTNWQKCSHVSWKKPMKLYRTSGIFNEYPLKNPEHFMGSRVIPSSYRMMSLNPVLAIMFMLYTLSLSSCSQSISSLVVVYFSERETW